jgi:hypothetical protein
MKENYPDMTLMKNALQNISDESVEFLDFDLLYSALDKSLAQLEKYSSIASELELLKNDYRKRILGMLKANIALKSDDTDKTLAARLGDSANDFSSAELVKIYAGVASRFRNNFPASFKYLSFGNIHGSKNWTEYKI